ncbi:galactokinase [Frankia sp. CH37]|nr:galactokinase [Parafrankia sp. CH37]
MGRTPEGEWVAPGRVNVIGEHTDHSEGLALPIALPQRVVVAAARRDDRHLVIHSAQMPDDRRTLRLDELEPGDASSHRVGSGADSPGGVDGWAAYVAGVAWALREAGHHLGGVDIVVDGDVPQGAGLSSSAALECATALALRDLFSLAVSRPELVRLAQRAENDFVGVPCGILDQSASLLATAGHALLLDVRSQTSEQIFFDLAAAGLTLLVIDTRTVRALVDGEYAARQQACLRAARQLGLPALRDATLDDVRGLADAELRRRARHVVTENARVAETAAILRGGGGGDVRAIGPLLTASHISLRDDFEVTVPQLDVAAAAAVAAGAYGARMTGGGFGGCVIALVDEDRADQVAVEVRREFARLGFQPPTHFRAVPSPGAHRIG